MPSVDVYPLGAAPLCFSKKQLGVRARVRETECGLGRCDGVSASVCVCVCVYIDIYVWVIVMSRVSCLQVRARLSAWYSASTANAGCSQMSLRAAQVAWQRVGVERTRRFDEKPHSSETAADLLSPIQINIIS